MKKLNYQIIINASKEKVWNTMLNKETYEKWTTIFNPSGSSFEGGWSTGDDIRFIGPDKNGTVSGMISKIKESRPYDYISIQHLGEINQGKENMWSGKEGMGTEAFENYTFTEVPEGTELGVELTASDSFPYDMEEMFQHMWPKALENLKTLVEK